MSKKNVIKTPHADSTPADVAISRIMQNLYATYGEKKVKASLKQLFNLAPQKKTKKVA